MKKLILAFSFAFALILTSCATTNTTSFTDPDFIGKRFYNICIYANVDDYQQKVELENEMTKVFSEKGVSVLQGSQLFPPTRKWTDEEIQKSLKDRNVDGYLLIQITNQFVKEEVGPATTTTSTKGEAKEQKGGKTTYKEVSTTTTSQAVSKQFYSQFKTDLIDVKSNRVAWSATSLSNSGENFSQDYSWIYESYSEDILKELSKKGHIAIIVK